jgi:hypothetical protein
MSTLAEAKGVDHYATLQSFVGWGARRPTPQENLCQVNLALAYGAKGILYWRYGAYDCWEDATGRTPFWTSVKDVVGPYIEKMGPIFASLQWQYAWKWGFEDKPPETPICEISCNEFGSDPIFCPDCLFMQIAELAPPSPDDTAKYFFLVNRRCLLEESITGTVEFEAFVDLAKSTILNYYVTDVLTDSTWMSTKPGPGQLYWKWNYSIPPGAGRLYRISPIAPEPPCTSCGDANSDDAVDIGDAVFLIQFIFAGGPAPGDCNYQYGMGDANGDCAVDISDAVYLIQYIFAGGPAPVCGTGCK